MLTTKREVEQMRPHKRDFLFTGDVSQKSVGDLTKKVLDVMNHDIWLKSQKSDYSPDPMRIYIDSYGGDAFSCLGLVSLFEASSTPIHTVVTGVAMSAGALIAIAGHTRFCYPHSTMMIHQISVEVEGNHESVKQEIVENERLNVRLMSIIQRHSSITKKRLDEICKRQLDWYMDANEAKSKGVIDVVLTKHDELFLYK